MRSRLETSFVKKNILMRHLYDKPELDVDAETERLYALGQKIKPFVCDTTKLLNDAYKRGDKILLEGQLGALRDPDHGIFPFTTSSSPLAGYAPVGAGLPPWAITEVVCVTKAYSSSVGTGVFPTQMHGQEAEELRKRGGDAGEYGAKTGRPRDVGWFDCVATRYGCTVQGCTTLAMTNIDVLGYLDEIKVCVGYELDGKVIRDFPVTPKLKRVKPIYHTLPGWGSDVSDVRVYEELPENCRNYIEFIEKEVGFPIKLISNGPERENLIYRNV